MQDLCSEKKETAPIPPDKKNGANASVLDVNIIIYGPKSFTA
jgi:hypothetical protein